MKTTFEQRLVAAAAENISYEVYCRALDQLAVTGRVTAFDLPAVLLKGFQDLYANFNAWVDEFGVTLSDLVKAFKQRDMFALLKGIGFNIKMLWKGVQLFTSLVPKGLMRVFKALLDDGYLDKLRSGAAKIDELMHKYPLLTKLSGIALGGFLVWVWLSMSFTGNPAFDLEVTTILQAFKGKFDLVDLFLSESGLTMLTLLATGTFTGIGVAWLGLELANLALALAYTGATKLKMSHVKQLLKPGFELKRI